MAARANRGGAVPRHVLRKAQAVRVLVVDADGVLTDGTIRYIDDGKELKVFHVLDGSGIAYLRREGYRTAIISGRACPAVEVRAREMKVDLVFQGHLNKLGAYSALKERFAVQDEEVCFVGDDLADLCLLDRVGLSVAVSNGVVEVRAAADYVTRAPGGGGAVREVAELLLKSRRLWAPLVNLYRAGTFDGPRERRKTMTEYGQAEPPRIQPILASDSERKKP